LFSSYGQHQRVESSQLITLEGGISLKLTSIANAKRMRRLLITFSSIVNTLLTSSIWFLTYGFLGLCLVMS
jgi:hypothetical protein